MSDAPEKRWYGSTAEPAPVYADEYDWIALPGGGYSKRTYTSGCLVFTHKASAKPTTAAERWYGDKKNG